MRRKKRIKAIIDTNLWISFLIGKFQSTEIIDFKEFEKQMN